MAFRTSQPSLCEVTTYLPRPAQPKNGESDAKQTPIRRSAGPSAGHKTPIRCGEPPVAASLDCCVRYMHCHDHTRAWGWHLRLPWALLVAATVAGMVATPMSPTDGDPVMLWSHEAPTAAAAPPLASSTSLRPSPGPALRLPCASAAQRPDLSRVAGGACPAGEAVCEQPAGSQNSHPADARLRVVLLPRRALDTVDGIHMGPLVCGLVAEGWVALDIDATVQSADVEADVALALGVPCPRGALAAVLLVDPVGCVCGLT